MDDLNKSLNHLFGFKVPIDDYDEFEKKVEEARKLKEHLDKVEILKDIPQIITPVKMTNYDRIKSMSVEEMANFINNDCNGVCGCCVFRRNTRCYEDEDKCKLGIKEWLESEVEENDR